MMIELLEVNMERVNSFKHLESLYELDFRIIN